MEKFLFFTFIFFGPLLIAIGIIIYNFTAKRLSYTIGDKLVIVSLPNIFLIVCFLTRDPFLLYPLSYLVAAIILFVQYNRGFPKNTLLGKFLLFCVLILAGIIMLILIFLIVTNGGNIG